MSSCSAPLSFTDPDRLNCSRRDSHQCLFLVEDQCCSPTPLISDSNRTGSLPFNSTRRSISHLDRVQQRPLGLCFLLDSCLQTLITQSYTKENTGLNPGNKSCSHFRPNTQWRRPWPLNAGVVETELNGHSSSGSHTLLGGGGVLASRQSSAGL